MPGCLRGWVRAETTHQVILKVDFKVNDHHGHFDSQQEFLFMTVLASFIDQNIPKYTDMKNICWHIHPSIYLSTYLPIYQSINHSIYQSNNLWIYHLDLSNFICYIGDTYLWKCQCLKTIAHAMNSGRRLAGEPPVKQPWASFPDPPVEDVSADVVHGALAAVCMCHRYCGWTLFEPMSILSVLLWPFAFCNLLRRDDGKSSSRRPACGRAAPSPSGFLGHYPRFQSWHV